MNTKKSMSRLSKRVAANILSILVILAIALPSTGKVYAQEEPNPHFTVFPEWEWFDGLDWPDGATVSISVADKPECGLERESWDYFFNGNFPEGCDIVSGDEVTFTNGSTLRVHTVQNLAVTEVSVDDDTISGLAEAGTTVYVWPHDGWFEPLETVADAEGMWQVNLSDAGYDIQPGSAGRSEIRDGAGNATAVDWYVPNPRLTASITDDWFRAEDFPSDDFVIFSIFSSEGGDLLWEEGRMTDGNGFLWVNTWELPVDLVPGMYLVVSSETVTKDIVLEPVLLFVLDLDNDFLSGSAPPERHVWVGTGNESYGCSMDVISDSDGDWEADFASQPCDVLSDMWAAAQVFDEDGDATEANPGFPRGSHDYDTGDVPSWACNAGGWAFDPDDQERPVPIRILVDDSEEPVLELTANADGNRGYEAHLWGLISSYETHEITVEAYDPESDTWRALEGTPRLLTCRTDDIYAYDPLFGTTKQITGLEGTDLRDTDEYNPSWSPYGKQVAHDVIRPDGSYAIYITDVKTSVSTLLVEGGNDAVWSQNGKWIAFDFGILSENPDLYLVRSEGGTPIFVREDAISADWAPNGKRLVFQDVNDGSVSTIAVNGGKGEETTVAPYGNNPVWSPDGDWIAYDVDGDIWKVRVNIHGVPLSEPIQITSGPFGDGQPTWSADSLTIAFHRGLSRDYDIWTIPATGGMATWLTGAFEFGDYDPSYAKNSSNIAYASFSPEGQAPRTWVAYYSSDIPAGTWSVGEHTYHFEWEQGSDSGRGDDLTFHVVNDEYPLYDGYVLLRPWYLMAKVGDNCEYIDTINPNQLTRFHIGWQSYGTYPEALTSYDTLITRVAWDDGSSEEFIRHEIIPRASEVDWFGYTCTYTNP